MKWFSILTASLAAILTLANCSSDSRSNINGDRCKEGAIYIPMTATAGEEILPFESLPSGTYQYGGSDFHFVEENGFQVLLRESALYLNKSKDDGTVETRLVTTPSTLCVRNASEASSASTLTINGASDLVTESATKVLTSVRSFGFNVQDGNMKADFKSTEEKVDFPTKAYPTADGAEVVLMKMPTGTDIYWEVRSRQVIPGKGTVTLRVRLTRVIPPTPAPPVAP